MPDGYKKLYFCMTKVFGEDRIDKRIDKLRGADILAIAVEKASSARKILKVAATVREIYCSEAVEELRKQFCWSGCQFKEEYSITEKEKKKCSIF